MADVSVALDEGFEAVRALDVCVPNTPRLDPVRRAAWQRARRIEGVNGPSPLLVASPDAPEPAPDLASAEKAS